MRYQVFNSADVEQSGKPAMSFPWKWLALLVAERFSLGWERCKVIDSSTGETLIEWARATRGIVFSSAGHGMTALDGGSPSVVTIKRKSIGQAAIFRCKCVGLCMLYGDGTVILDPKAGDPMITRRLMIACGDEIVPVLQLAQTLRGKGIALTGVGLGQCAVTDILNGHVVDVSFDLANI